jgi:IS30 family transposase
MIALDIVEEIRLEPTYKGLKRKPARPHAIALKLNTRPLKTLCYRTPAATLAQTVALTG